MTFGGVILIVLDAIFVHNYVLSRFLGCCPFLGVSKKLETAVGMGVAVTFVMALSSVFTYLVQYYLLEPLGIAYMQTVAFVLVIAALVQFVEIVIQKMSPTLHKALGIYLPLITTNCVVLGVAIINIEANYGLWMSMINGVAAALSFTFALILFAGVRERLTTADIPKPLRGFPIALIAAGLMAIAFLGFQGMISLS